MACKTGKLCEDFIVQSRKIWNVIKQAEWCAHNLWEDSITDFNLLNLKRRHPLEVQTVKFSRREEGNEGADWEWWLVSPGLYMGLRVQAKIINPRNLRYEKLSYSTPKGRQIDLLINKATGGSSLKIPIYVLYNFWDCNNYYAPWLCGSRKRNVRMLGCGIVEARAMRTLVNRGKDGLEDIAEMMYPWSCLVCCRAYSPAGNYALPSRAFHFLSNAFGEKADYHYERNRLVIKKAPWYVNAILEKKELPEEAQEEIGVNMVTVIQERPEYGY